MMLTGFLLLSRGHYDGLLLTRRWRFIFVL